MSHPVLDVIHARRSIRRYRPELPSEALLRTVLEAGRAAPSGGNSQSCHFLVIRSAAVLSRLRALVEACFASMEAGPDTYRSLRSSITLSKRGGYDFTLGAPVLVVAANRRGYGNALADTACALENMMLAAQALGLGSCWINQLHWLDDAPPVRAYLEALGLDPGETVCGGLALGWPDQSPAPIEHTGNRVDWIDADVELPG